MPSYRTGIGRLHGESRYDPLAHGALRAECVRLGIDLDVALAVQDDKGDMPCMSATQAASTETGAAE